MATVRAENVYKVFGKKPDTAVRRLQDGATRDELRAEGVTSAVIDASFEAKEGETFVVMGLSGSGKSTLIRMLNGILPASSGSIFVGEDDVTQLTPSELRTLRSEKMSMVFQHFALFPHRTVLENAAYGLEVRGEDKNVRREKAAEALETVGLKGWDKSYPSELSGGMKQRVGLARALATDTDVMLMDEAFSALDPLIRREMQDQLVELQQRLHKTIIFITHDLNEAMKLGDRIAMMRDGRVVQVGTPKDFLSEPANDYVATFVEDVDRTRVLTAGSVMTEPPATVRTNDPITVAQRSMTDRGLSAIHVLDANGRVVGGLTTEDASSGRTGTCGQLANSDVVTTTTSELIVNLFEQVAYSAISIAVVDDNEALIGVITRERLLTSVGTSAANQADAHTNSLAGQET